MAKRPRAKSTRRPTGRRTPKRKPARARRGVRFSALRRGVIAGAWVMALIGAVVVMGYTAYLDHQVRERFEGARWELPARVFARPLEIYQGKALSADALIEELRLLHYQSTVDLIATGAYRAQGETVTLHSRGFPFWDAIEPTRLLRVEFLGNSVAGVFAAGKNTPLDLVRLEPVPIANIYPTHLEDRLVARLEDVPPLLPTTLIAVEDRDFYDHHGLDFGAIARAMLANIMAGRVVQGGSTLTQQLVKNLFLTSERSLVRKLNEAIMAGLLEWHYGKDEILEAYINEVYLGQDGARAIHGFALASQFYFERRLSELRPDQLALLVALVKGPSYYQPRQNPERAKDRRDLVLAEVRDAGVLSAAAATEAQNRPLDVTARAPSGVTPFPAFVELMRRQLKDQYPEQALRTKGLVIFTTMDPLVQIAAEQAVTSKLAELEAQRGLPASSLQAAAVVTAAETGEVLAVVGGRDPRAQGYNRALDARRPIGSLVKPVIYVTALARPREYSLASMLDDRPLSVRLDDKQTWSPRNYDDKYHGQVTLRDALVGSYNVSTARLGLAVGIDNVIDTLQRLGFTHSLSPYPSLLLGALEMTPLEVSQVYQTLAAGGYRAPLNTIREVMSGYGERLSRYPLNIAQGADPAAVYLLNAALYEVTRQGTARALQWLLPAELKVAGKTGSTNELRDSWFAGFSGEHLAVTWIGRDDNQSTGLTGAVGALPVWADIMGNIQTRPLNLNTPPGTEWLMIDPRGGLLADEYCEGAQWMPFVEGSAPTGYAPCAQISPVERTTRWFQGLFN
ncbi:MAG: penicillin-binding protein 1B [Gammaproteobacteria bacterium]|nr:penicillin-binding protein 1B [Gammaproteobacteria bacterium]